ncbi:hypothetical protein [Geodermatophilus sp. SYSU D01105]
MRRSRLLLALPAATALVFTGAAPAWAGGDDGHHNGDDAWAKVVEIDDEAELGDDGDTLDVTFTYKCEDDDDKDDITADVTAEKDDIKYEAEDEELKCDGEENEITVTLDKKDEAAEEGDWVEVTVTISDGDDELDEESEWVEVVDEENGDDNGHRDGDKDHHKDHH